MASKSKVTKKAATRKPATKKSAAAPKQAKKKKVTKKSSRAPAKPRPQAVVINKTKRGIFIDVENTSSEAELLNVFQELKVNQLEQPTEIVGIGNWKALGSRFARTLGRHGAQLLHTAPPTGVRDWSDLWIAVNVGIWLARATPGDLLDIVSDDRAFDAIADAAAGAGVTFRRLSYRGLPSARTREPEIIERPRRGRRRRKGNGPRPEGAAPAPAAAAMPAAPQHEVEEDSHSASHAHIRDTLQRLALEKDGWVSLDALANTLRAEGFTRPPGSPRLLTRLRRMKDVDLQPNGMLRLIPEAVG